MTDSTTLPAGGRVALYARVSTAEQARSGASLAMQVDRMRAYCVAHDLAPVAEVIDDGYSGKDLDRPGVVELRRLVDERKISGLVIYKLDRLTRSVRDFGDVLARLDEAGVGLQSVTDSLDTRSAAGRLVVNVMLSVSQWERETIGERTREALAHKAARGERVGRPRIGWRVENGELVPTAQVALVREAHRLRASGLTLRQIAVRFEQSAEWCAMGGRARWHAAQVARLLRSPQGNASASSTLSP